MCRTRGLKPALYALCLGLAYALFLRPALFALCLGLALYALILTRAL